MQSFEGPHSSKSLDTVSNKQSLRLLYGAVATALLTGTIAGAFGGLVAALALLVTAFMVIAISDYRAGILIAMLLLPLSATQLIPRELFGIIGLNPLNATLAMSMLSLLVTLLFQRKQCAVPTYPRLLWIYIGVLGFAALQGVLHVSSIPAFYQLEKMINFDNATGYVRDIFLKPMLIVLTALMLAIAVRNARRPTLFLAPLFLSAVVMASVVNGYIAMSGVSLSVLASGHSRDFLSAIGMHANELGFMFNMAFALALFCFFSMRGSVSKWLLGAAIPILTVATILTFSRGAYLGFLAVVTYFLFTRRKFSVILAGLLLLIIAIAFAPQAVVDRVTAGTHGGGGDDVSAGRVERIWLPLLPEITTSPVIGHGLSSIMWSDAAREGLILRVGHPHSAYLGVLLDFGLVGAFLILLFFRHMWRLFARLAEHSPDPLWRGFFKGATACILLLLVQGITDDRFTPTFPQTFLWLAYGMAIGLVGRAGATDFSGAAQDGVA